MIVRISGVLCALLMIAGCSGGGGGDGITAAQINAANATIIAGSTLAAVAAVSDLNSLDNIADDFGSPPTAPGQTADAPPVAEITIAVDDADLDMCLTGSVTGTVSIRDPDVVVQEDRLLPGDGAKLNLASCELEPGEVYSGGIDFRVARFIGTLCLPQEYILDFKLRNLVRNDPAESERADGDVSFFYSQVDFPLIDTALSGRRLDIDENGQSASLRNYELASQSIAVSRLDPTYFGVSTCQAEAILPTTESIKASYDGYLSSSAFDGEVQFITLEPFIREVVPTQGPLIPLSLVAAGYGPLEPTPSAGRLLILGADNASVELTVDGSVIRIAVDSNGDGVFDVSTTSTWAALTNANPG